MIQKFERAALWRGRWHAFAAGLAASVLFVSCGGSDSPVGPTPSVGPVTIQLDGMSPASGASLAIDDGQQNLTALEVRLTVSTAVELRYGTFRVEPLFADTQTPCAFAYGPSQPFAAGQSSSFRINLFLWNKESCPFPAVISAIRVTATDSGEVQGQLEFPARYTVVGRSGVAPPAAGSREVLIAGNGDSCYPKPGHECTVPLAALVSPVPGETLSYSWSGCATGTAALTQCVFTGLSTSTATVEVRSSRGWTASASATARGANSPPAVDFSFPAELSPERSAFGVGNLFDEEGCSSTLELKASGACDRGVVTCHGYGLDLEVHTARGPGSCTVTVTARDAWGAVGTTTNNYRVAR